MQTDIITIGNSKGVRLPKAVLQQCGFGASVELEVKDQCVILRAPHRPRQGWAEAYAKMAERSDDAPLMEDMPMNSFDESEWEW